MDSGVEWQGRAVQADCTGCTYLYIYACTWLCGCVYICAKFWMFYFIFYAFLFCFLSAYFAFYEFLRFFFLAFCACTYVCVCVWVCVRVCVHILIERTHTYRRAGCRCLLLLILMLMQTRTAHCAAHCARRINIAVCISYGRCRMCVHNTLHEHTHITYFILHTFECCRANASH